MVAMMGFQYERDGPGTKCWPVGCGQNTTGKVPKLCGGGNQSGEYAIVENCCAELKSHSTHVLMPLVMLPLHHYHPCNPTCEAEPLQLSQQQTTATSRQIGHATAGSPIGPPCGCGPYWYNMSKECTGRVVMVGGHTNAVTGVITGDGLNGDCKVSGWVCEHGWGLWWWNGGVHG